MPTGILERLSEGGAVACHVREMARALGKVSAGEREWRSPTGKPMSGLELHQPEGR